MTEFRPKEEMPRPAMYAIIICIVVITLACGISMVMGAGHLAGLW